MLAIVYRVHIWQVLPQLSCGDTCQIWMWCKLSNRYFDRIENFAYGEINERSFSNPHPSSSVTAVLHHNQEEWTYVSGYEDRGSYEARVSIVSLYLIPAA